MNKKTSKAKSVSADIEVREAERAEELNEPVTDVEPTAEAPAQESTAEPTEPKATEVV